MNTNVVAKEAVMASRSMSISSENEIKKTYGSVSQEPERDFIFPTGRAWAEDLRYPPELANVPDTAVEVFAGVANPWELDRGERVLDVQVPHGFDSVTHAKDYLAGELFTGDVVSKLGPLLQADPEIRVLDVAQSLDDAHRTEWRSNEREQVPVGEG
jgi:hypothetical protein